MLRAVASRPSPHKSDDRETNHSDGFLQADIRPARNKIISSGSITQERAAKK
jgi:hypothetical protein